MKKLRAAAAVLLILLALAPAAYAEEYGAVFGIDIDRCEWDVIILGENEEQFSERAGMTYDQLSSFMENSNTYIDALNKENASREVTVRRTAVTDEKYSDLRLLDRGEQESYALECAAWFESMSPCSCDYVEIYRHDQTDFLVFDIMYTPSDREEYFGRRYYTSVNGCNVFIDMYNYSDPLGAEEYDELKSIVDTVRFDGLKSRAFLPNALRVLRWIFLTAAVGAAAGAVVLGIKDKKRRKTISDRQRSRQELEKKHRAEMEWREQQPREDVISYPGRNKR